MPCDIRKYVLHVLRGDEFPTVQISPCLRHGGQGQRPARADSQPDQRMLPCPAAQRRNILIDPVMDIDFLRLAAHSQNSLGSRHTFDTLQWIRFPAVFQDIDFCLQSDIYYFAGLFFIAFIKPINSTPAFLVPDLFGRKHYLEFNSLSNGVYYAGICANSQSTSLIMTLLGGVQTLIYLGVVAVVAAAAFMFALALSPLRSLQKSRK